MDQSTKDRVKVSVKVIDFHALCQPYMLEELEQWSNGSEELLERRPGKNKASIVKLHFFLFIYFCGLGALIGL